MNKNITVVTLIATILLSSNMKAQELPTHEIGIQLSNLQGFSLIYKKELETNKLARLQIGTNDFLFLKRKENDKSKQMSINLSLGREKRRNLNERTDFVHGFIPFVSILNRSRNDDRITNATVGIAYLLGIRHEFNDAFYTSLECMPSISGIINKQTDLEAEFGYNLGFYNNIVNITLAHRFKIKKKEKPNN